MKWCTSVLACAAILCQSAMSGELAGVTMPDTLKMESTTLKLNGMGLRKKLWVKVYVGGLYLEHPSHDPEEILSRGGPWQVVMYFLHSKVSVDKLNGAWIDGFKKNAPEILETHEKEVEQFTSFFRDVVKGEDIVLTFLPAEGLTVRIAGEVVGKTIPVEFANAVLSIWLGPEPPSGGLKEGMLGLKN